LRSVEIGVPYYFKIYTDKHEHAIDVAGRMFSIDLKPQKISYLLRPYFGGNQTAPHDMIIDMKRI